jgi:hypothetical protein
MTLKMYQIIDFPSFFSKIKSQKLPFKTSYHLTILAQEIEKHIGFYQEKFHELIMNYAKKDEEGNLVPSEDGSGVMLAEETMQEAYSKLAELRDLDVELPDIKISIDDLSEVELSIVEMNVILPFIKG